MTSIQIHVRSQYSALSRAEQKAADYLLTHLDEIYSLPISELADRSGVSAGTWVRLCKSLGFQGLKDLKHQLFTKASEFQKDEGGPELVFTDIKDHQNIRQIIDSVQASSTQAITSTLQFLDPATLESAADLVYQANSIRLFGVGASSLVAQDLAYKLMRIGLNVQFSQDLHIQLTSAATLHPGDLAIIISNSGATKEMIEIQKLVRKNGVQNLAITSLGKSPLAQHADLALQTTSPEIHLRSGAMSSRIAQLVMVDCLFTTLANKNYREIEQNLERSYESSLPHRLVL